MTHTLHRAGSPEDLAGDYVILAMAAKGVNRANSAPKFRQLAEILLAFNPVNLGDLRSGTSLTTDPKKIARACGQSGLFHAVFTDAATVARALQAIKDSEIGLSIVVSGLCGEVARLAGEVGLAPHTTNQSFGVWGDTARLPPKPIMAVTTMCGHGLVARNLVLQMIEDVRAGRRPVEEAAVELGRQCVCGVFNTKRAEMLLNQAAAAGK